MSFVNVLLVPENYLDIYGRRGIMIDVNTAKVREFTGYTDDQIDYLVKVIDVLKRGKAQGKPREYSYRDIVFLRLSTRLRNAGITLRDINKIFNLLVENSNKTAALAIYPTNKGKPIVQLTFDVTENDVLNMFMSKPAQSFLLDGLWLTPEDEDKPILFVGNIPYDDQLDLELEKVMMNETQKTE